MISRPCADIRLWNALAEILRLGNAVLFFPGGQHPLIAAPSVKQHLPPDMIEALGEPLIISTGAEILKQVRAA